MQRTVLEPPGSCRRRWARLPLGLFLAWVIVDLAIPFWAPSARADWILFQSDFDDLSVGAPLGRGGAALHEPIVGPCDTATDVVVVDGLGDQWVAIHDPFNGTVADCLTFGFQNNQLVTDGYLDISFVVQPQTIDNYLVRIFGEDIFDGDFFRLTFSETAQFTYGDANTLEVILGSYIAKVSFQVDVRFDLTVGSYDLSLNGIPVTLGKPNGLAGRGIKMINFEVPSFESNGELWIDDVRAIYIPADPTAAPPLTGAALLPQLFAAIPNPFNPRTSISFRLPSSGPVELRVFDLRGRRVRTLVDEPLAAGLHHRIWDGRDDRGFLSASGIYRYVLRTENGWRARSVTLIK